jgi:hypothetical protein
LCVFRLNRRPAPDLHQLTVMTFAILPVEITAQPTHTLLRSGA